MIRNSDVQWWILEASKDPESAPAVIEELAKRLAELDAENERLRGEVLRLQSRPAAAASGQVSALQRKVEKLESALQDQAPTEAALLLVSDDLGLTRIPLSRAWLCLRENRPALPRSAASGVRHLLCARPQENLLLLTSRGRAIRMLLHEVPTLVEGSDWPAAEESPLLEGERVTAAVAAARPPRFWSVVTRRGYVRQRLQALVEQQLGRDEPVFESPLRNDEPAAIVDGDRGDLLIVTRWGQVNRFPQLAISGQGCVALQLEQDDQVVAALPLPSDREVMVVTAAGRVMRRDTSRFAARSQPGGRGKALIQAFDVLGAFPYAAQGKLVFLTYSGRFRAAEAAEIPLQARLGEGARALDLSHDPAVAAAFVPGALL